jgi:hypothetical protein
VPGQSPDQSIDLLVDAAAAGGQGVERQARAQRLRAVRGARADLPQRERMTIEASEDSSVRARFKADVTGEPDRQRDRRGTSASL